MSFGKEGFTLRLIINKLARTLLDKGYVDEDCENKIVNYRQKRLQYYPIKLKSSKRFRRERILERFLREEWIRGENLEIEILDFWIQVKVEDTLGYCILEQ